MLTWEDCVKEAKKSHPDLISAEAVVNQAKANKAIATSNILPHVSTELRLHLKNSYNEVRYLFIWFDCTTVAL